MSEVSTKRQDYLIHLQDWELVRDCFMGQKYIKSATTQYLPLLTGIDDINDAKYQKYLELAMFYNVIRKTSKALCGLAFSREPLIELDNQTELDYIHESCSLDNENIEQLTKRVLQNVINFGRCGILVDYPNVDGIVTKSRKESESINSYFSLYTTFSIINWNVQRIGSTRKLDLVVLEEDYLEFTGFQSTSKKRWRVLQMEEGFYKQSVVYEDGKPTEEYFPTDNAGNRLTEIPFIFIGSENNNSEIDSSPLLDLAYMNIKHYQYYADNAIKLHYQAVPLLVFENLDKSSFEALSSSNVSTGATKAMALTGNAQAKYLEIAETSSLTNEIDKIELKMISAGAKLVKNDAINESATTSRIKASSENSELINIMDNVSAGLTQCLKIMCLFEGANPDNIEIKLNAKIVEEMTDNQLLSVVLNAVTQGQAPKIALFNGIKKSGLLDSDMTYEDFTSMVEQESESFAVNELR